MKLRHRIALGTAVVILCLGFDLLLVEIFTGYRFVHVNNATFYKGGRLSPAERRREREQVPYTGWIWTKTRG